MKTAAEKDPRLGLVATVKRAGLIKNNPTATNTINGTSLLMVNRSLALADSLTPNRLIAVRRTTSAVIIATRGRPDSAGGQK